MDWQLCTHGIRLGAEDSDRRGRAGKAGGASKAGRSPPRLSKDKNAEITPKRHNYNEFIYLTLYCTEIIRKVKRLNIKQHNLNIWILGIRIVNPYAQKIGRWRIASDR